MGDGGDIGDGVGSSCNGESGGNRAGCRVCRGKYVLIVLLAFVVVVVVVLSVVV